MPAGSCGDGLERVPRAKWEWPGAADPLSGTQRVDATVAVGVDDLLGQAAGPDAAERAPRPFAPSVGGGSEHETGRKTWPRLALGLESRASKGGIEGRSARASGARQAPAIMTRMGRDPEGGSGRRRRLERVPRSGGVPKQPTSGPPGRVGRVRSAYGLYLFARDWTTIAAGTLIVGCSLALALGEDGIKALWYGVVLVGQYLVARRLARVQGEQMVMSVMGCKGASLGAPGRGKNKEN